MTNPTQYPWWKWPRSARRPGFVPWYNIIRRSIAAVLFGIPGMILYVLFVFLGYGFNEAKKACHDMP